MIKKLLSLLICMTLMSSCATYAMPNDTIRTSDDVYTEAAAATIVTLAAATVMYDWVWAWNGAAYTRYYCAPYYSHHPYYWRGPRHHAPHHWRGLPPHRPRVARPVRHSHTPHHGGGFHGPRGGGHFHGHGGRR